MRQHSAIFSGWRLGAVGLVLLATCLIPVTPAQAVLVTSPANTGGFEIDGDLPVNNGGTYDWANDGVVITDGTGDATQFAGGSESTNPSTWTTGGGGAAGKADLVTAYTSSRIVAGQAWAYFGVRRDSTTGTTAFSFEFNQLANSPVGSPRPQRTPGDLLLSAEQQGNSSFGLAGASIWTLQTEFGGGCQLIPGYVPAAGWCPASLPAGTFFGTTGENGAFAEGALNLSRIFGSTCVGDFASLNIRSRSSTALNSSLQDWVRPITQSVPGTCGLLRVAKVNQFGENVPRATFQISPDPRPGGNAASLTITEGGAGDTDGVANGVIIIDPVEPGTYTVTETAAPPGYLLPPPGQRSNTVVVAPSGQSLQTYLDTLPWTPLTLTKTAIATYDASYAWTIDKTVSPPTQWTPDGTPARFDYQVTVSAGAETRSGFEVHGVISINNPNTHAMVATVSDQLSDGTECVVDATDVDVAAPGQQIDVPAGGIQLDYVCDGLDTGTPGTNTATLTWSRADYPETQADVNDPAGAADVTVSTSRGYVFEPDQLTDEEVTVTDSLMTFDPDWVIPWGVGTVETRSYSLDLVGEAGTCVNKDNTATITSDSGVLDEASAGVEVCTGLDLEITKNATLTYDRAYNWAVTKSGPATIFVGGDDFVGPATYQVRLEATDWTDTNQTLGGTITVRNPNDWDVPADITDVVTVDGVDYDCVVINGVGATIPGDTSVDFSYRCDGIAQGDYVGTNTATVTWDGAEFASPHSSHDVTVPVEVDEDTTPLNDTVTLTDSMGRTFQSLSWAEVKAAGGQTFTYSADLTGAADECVPVQNTVTIDQTGVAAAITTEVCAPQVTKTADATFAKEYAWDVRKSVDHNFAEVSPDGSATFGYTVTAIPTGEELIYWNWVGTITVANPSTTEPLTVDIADFSGVPDATCEVADGTAVLVPPAGETTVDYACTSTSKSVAPGTNTAVASFGDEAVSRQIPVVFREGDSVNAEIAIQDSRVGTLGLATWNAAGTPMTFVYGVAYPAGDPGQCQVLTNTASVPHHTASADVRVCTEAPLTVTKTAEAGLTRTYHWSLDKTVRDESLTGEVGRFTYDVRVQAEPYTDSDWTLTGAISLTNPNAYAEGTIAAEVSELPTGLAAGDSCMVSTPGTVIVPPGQTVAVPYTCELSAEPAPDASNTATAIWDPAGPEAEASATAAPVAITPTPSVEVDKTVEVVDDLTAPGTSHVIAGPLNWSEDFDTTYTYSIRQQVGEGTCRTFTNTATLQSTDVPDRARARADSGVLLSDSVDTELCATQGPPRRQRAVAEHRRPAGIVGLGLARRALCGGGCRPDCVGSAAAHRDRGTRLAANLEGPAGLGRPHLLNLASLTRAESLGWVYHAATARSASEPSCPTSHA